MKLQVKVLCIACAQPGVFTPNNEPTRAAIMAGVTVCPENELDPPERPLKAPASVLFCDHITEALRGAFPLQKDPATQDGGEAQIAEGIPKSTKEIRLNPHHVGGGRYA